MGKGSYGGIHPSMHNSTSDSFSPFLALASLESTHTPLYATYH
jgi:hypothetical protein